MSSYVMFAHPAVAAQIDAVNAYAGRDHRRIKREMRKAEQRATKQMRSARVGKDPSQRVCVERETGISWAWPPRR